MNYAELRRTMSRIIPGTRPLFEERRQRGMVREKGRKSNYQQYNLLSSEWVKRERLLNTEEIQSFLEISMRAAACPMPLNMDVYDGFTCVAEGQRVRTQRGDVPIETVQLGDQVLTFNEETLELEWKPVTHVSSAVRTDMVEVETEEGTIRLTADHRVLTQRGWVQAGELTNDDVMYSY